MGSFPPWSFLPMGVGEQPCQRFTGVWRSRLPPQSFLPVGIGEAAPLVTSFDFFDFISLPPQSFLPLGIRDVTLLILGLATPATSHAGVALCAFPGDALGISRWRRLLRLYTWASSELLDECSCLLSTRAIREHKGDSCSYDTVPSRRGTTTILLCSLAL